MASKAWLLFIGNMEYKSIKTKIGSPDALCIFAIPEDKARWKLLLAKVSDRDEFLKENPTCTQWALLADAPSVKKRKTTKA